jgi:hypothetical protein
LPALYWLFGEREAAREAVALGDAWPAEAPLTVAAEGT